MVTTPSRTRGGERQRRRWRCRPKESNSRGRYIISYDDVREKNEVGVASRAGRQPIRSWRPFTSFSRTPRPAPRYRRDPAAPSAGWANPLGVPGNGGFYDGGRRRRRPSRVHNVRTVPRCIIRTERLCPPLSDDSLVDHHTCAVAQTAQIDRRIPSSVHDGNA